MANEFGTISLNDEVQPFGSVSLNSPNEVPSISPDVAQPRALKANFGLGDQSPGFDALYSGISNGQENQLRQDISRQYDSYLRSQKMSAIGDIARQGSMGNVEHAKALLAWNPQTNPDTIFENTYAQRYTNEVANNDIPLTVAAMDTAPEAVHKAMDNTQNIIANMEGFNKVIEESDQLYNQESRISKTSSLFYGMIPGRNALLLHNILTETASNLPGDNLDEQITYLWSLPSDQAIPLFRQKMKALYGLDPGLANEFAHAVTNFSEQHRMDLNLGLGIDVAAVSAPFLGLFKKLRGSVKANSAKTPNVANTLEAIGDTEKAADIKAVEITKALDQPEVLPTMDRGYDPLGQKLDLTSVLPSSHKPESLATPSDLGSFSREKALRIVGQLKKQNELIEKTTSNIARPVRITDERLQFGLGEAKTALKEQFPHVQDTVLDFRTSSVYPWEHIRAQDVPGNVDYVAMNIGKGGSVQRLENDLGFPLGPVRGSEPETVRSAAIRLTNGTVIEAESHGIAMLKAEAITGKSIKDVIKEHFNVPKGQAEANGFVTNKGRFVTEAEANKLTKAAKPETTLTRLTPEEIASSKDEHVRDYANDTNVVSAFKFKTKDGKTGHIVAHINEDNPKDLIIHWVGNKQGLEAKTNQLGKTFIRNLIPSLEKEFPGIETLSGTRVSGARGADFTELGLGTRVTIKIPKPKFITAVESKAWGEVVIGRNDASLFKTASQADVYAQEHLGLNFDQYRTMQGPGDKWYISVVRPIDETSSALRELALETNNKNSESFLNAITGVGYSRTPAEQVSKFLRNNRLLATVGQSKLHAMIKTLAKPIEDLRQYPTGGKTMGKVVFGKTSYDKLIDVLQYYNMFQDYSKPMSRGMYPTSFGQLAKDWHKVTSKLINEREALAFWTAVKINDFDWTLRNFNLHRDFARQNIEHISIPIAGEEGLYHKPFLGKVIRNENFPWRNPEDASLAVYRDGQYSHHMKNTVIAQDTEETKNLKAWMDKPSVKITQLAVPEGEPLKEAVGFNPHFVISEDIQRTPLPVKLVDHNPGGHVIYPASHYSKQPVVEQGKFGNFYHYGDRTLAAWETKAQADRYTPRLDTFRKMMKNGATDAELDAFVRKNLPNDLEFWKNKFEGKNAFYSLDHPIVTVKRGETSFTSNPRLKETYKGVLGQDVVSYPDSSYSLSKGIDKSFLQDRDGPLQTIVKENPWTPGYRLQLARILNPMYSLERGMYNAIRGLYLNDVKTASVEQWIRQYRDLFTDPIDKVMRNPYYQFYHGQLNDADRNRYMSALNARRNLKNLLKTSSDLQEDVDHINEAIVKGLYALGTPDRAINWFASKDWNAIKHPIDYLRSASSNLIFGHYNPVQSFKQTLGAMQAIFIDPRYGYQGATASVLHNLYRIGESHLEDNVRSGVMKYLDKAAILGGWKPGELEASIQAMERTGFDKVGREVAWRDSISGDKLFGTGKQNYLDKSYVFFNWGDRNNRMVAWHMAYKRFINENPNRIVDDRALGEILNRADLLGQNMTKESNSALQKGIAGPLLQFRSFQMRVFEQFMGSRLTPGEKVRAFIASSIAYGVPVTFGAYVLPIENWYDDMKGYLIKNGIVDPSKPEEVSTWIRNFHDGMLDHMIFMATGKHYNVAKSYGPGPDQSISKLGQDGIQDVLGMAPAGSTLESIIKVTQPFYAAVKTAQNPANETFKITNQDIMDVIRNIKTADLAYNMYMAANYQMFVGKNKQIVDDKMDNTDTVMMTLGLTKQDITDARLGQSIAHDQSAYEDKQAKGALEEYRSMLWSFSKQDYKMADLYLARANVYLNVLGDVSQQKKDQIWKQALSESPNLADRVNELLYSPERIPPSQLPARLRKHFGIEVNQ